MDGPALQLVVDPGDDLRHGRYGVAALLRRAGMAGFPVGVEGKLGFSLMRHLNAAVGGLGIQDEAPLIHIAVLHHLDVVGKAVVFAQQVFQRLSG